MPSHSTSLCVLAVMAVAVALPPGASAASTCSYDVATATVQAQMLSPRVVIRSAGDDRILVDGHACASAQNGAVDATLATTRQIIVASVFAPGTDTVVVDESHGRVENRETGNRPKVLALTGSGGDTMEVIGTPGRDRYVAHDDLRASVDLDADSDPDFISTDVLRVVLFGKGGDDSLVASAGPHDRMSHRAELYGGLGNDFLRGGRSGDDRLDGGPGNDRVLARGTAGDRLIGGRGFDEVRADAGDTATGFERACVGQRR